VSDRILIVGATGFLGGFVTARLADRDPIALVRPTSETASIPRQVTTRTGALEADLPLEDIGTLVYCASMGFGHVPGLVRQLEASGVKRAIFISTTAIFTLLGSRSRAVRLEAETAVMSSGMDWTILRPTMIYGTGADRNISRLLRFLKRSPIFPVCGNGLWQPIYVADLADAVASALDSPHTSRRAYNVAGAEPLRFTDLVRTAARAIGRHVALVRVPLEAAVLVSRLAPIVTPEQIRRLAEDKAFPYTEATRDFGFAPRTFAEGVAKEAEALGLRGSVPGPRRR
jgi:nucleoside-diphosphate-sugar epimerase